MPPLSKSKIYISFFFHRKGKRRVTRMVVVVVLAFAVCWLPIQVTKYSRHEDNSSQ